MKTMGEVFQALLDGKALEFTCCIVALRDGELVVLNKDLSCQSKFMPGAFIFNEPEGYHVYVKEGERRVYTTAEAAQLLKQGKKIKVKCWKHDYLHMNEWGIRRLVW